MNAPTLKLDLACGVAKQPGWFGVDSSPDTQADLVLDLTKMPWPWADGSVAEVRCAHFFEHLSSDDRIRFMEEVWRILVPGGKATITVPHGRSDGAVQDPTHQWPPVVENSFQYFNREARELMRVSHYPIRCDFDIELGIRFEAHWEARPQQEKVFALKHFDNVAKEIVAFLTRR